MERFIKIVLDSGYIGTREEFYAKTNMTDEQLNDYINDMALEYAVEYDYMVYDTDVETFAEDCGISIEDAEAEMEEFYEETCANSYWEEVIEEEAVENGYENFMVNN